MRRYQLKLRTLAIEADFNDIGLHYLRSLRTLRPDLFRRGRITDILQCKPGEMPTGLVYRINGETLGPPMGVTRAAHYYDVPALPAQR